jgi:hypothetical protein
MQSRIGPARLSSQTNVVQRWPELPRGLLRFRYLLTVRGAICSSPPCWVFTRHPEYQFSEIFRKRRTTGSVRFPSPDDLERGPMPSDEVGGLHDHERSASRITFRRDHRQTKRCRGAARLYLAFLEQSELFPKEKILGHQGDTCAKEPNECQQLRILQELAGRDRTFEQHRKAKASVLLAW